MVTSLNKLKFQKTIKKEISISGIGLHTGLISNITLKPAPSNHGIKFKRIDLKKSPKIEASVLNVIDVTRGTTIGKDKIEIHTIEHLLAAISGLNIDNLLIEIDNIEIKTVTGLLTEFAQANHASCIIRGLRAVSDFEYEFQMTGMNYQLNSDIETIFLMSSDKNSFISSNLVKEVHKLGGDVSKFVSSNTIKILNNKNSSL